MTEWHDVKSSNLRKVGYDRQSLTLSVEFHSGSIYTYAGVMPETFAALLSAPSKGHYFDARIKGRPFTKIK